MDRKRNLLDDKDYKNGFRDGRMDALLPRAGTDTPIGGSEAYQAGYAAGTESVRPAAHKAA